jgi:hypothetical protein
MKVASNYTYLTETSKHVRVLFLFVNTNKQKGRYVFFKEKSLTEARLKQHDSSNESSENLNRCGLSVERRSESQCHELLMKFLIDQKEKELKQKQNNPRVT